MDIAISLLSLLVAVVALCRSRPVNKMQLELGELQIRLAELDVADRQWVVTALQRIQGETVELIYKSDAGGRVRQLRHDLKINTENHTFVTSTDSGTFVETPFDHVRSVVPPNVSTNTPSRKERWKILMQPDVRCH